MLKHFLLTGLVPLLLLTAACRQQKTATADANTTTAATATATATKVNKPLPTDARPAAERQPRRKHGRPMTR